MLGNERMDRLVRLMDVSVVEAHVHAANLANQNTPGYRAKAVDFTREFEQALQRGDHAGAMAVEPELIEPRETSVGVDGNDVAPDREILAAADNAMRYNAYISIMRGQMRLMNIAVGQSP
ncbi:MAG TPA: flagellar basal body rod protein FlgB [Planctomycetota bacterium]|nr:flagellar basal body rod protein FlgB [Planctomycetota bacterium]